MTIATNSPTIVEPSAESDPRNGSGETPQPEQQADGAGPASVTPAAQPLHDIGNELMMALQRGDRAALRRLHALYNPKLYSFICRIVVDPSTAEDIVQETWMTLYERRQGYQPTFKFSTWLFTIARRKALSELRRRSVRSIVRSLTHSGRSGETEDLEFRQNVFCDPDASADGALVAKIVERALGSLSPQQREIVVLRDIEGFENDEIAMILQWTLKPGALRKRIFDAREAFRRAMHGQGYRD
ncbi:MAG: polymerase sigma-70 factor, subfamily [Chlorobi bacterium]|nr:polymerase sigma-70 factor, subfamily [Chlorobiota bacterium]